MARQCFNSLKAFCCGYKLKAWFSLQQRQKWGVEPFKFFKSELDSSVFEILPVQCWYRPSVCWKRAHSGDGQWSVLSAEETVYISHFSHAGSLPKPRPALMFPALSCNISPNPFGLLGLGCSWAALGRMWVVLLSEKWGKEGYRRDRAKMPYCSSPSSSQLI